MRPADADALVSAVAAWALTRQDIRGMAGVGSLARGHPRRGSDIPLLLLSDRTADYRRRRTWLAEIDFDRAGYRVLSSENASCGAAWSRHVTLAPAAQVELTFAR